MNKYCTLLCIYQVTCYKKPIIFYELMSGRSLRSYNRATTKEEEKLGRQGDKIKFVDVNFEAG